MNINLRQLLKGGLCVTALIAGTNLMAWVSTRPNIFGGYDIVTPGRTYTGMPNIFGGIDFRGMSSGFRGFSTRPNIFGGYDIVTPGRTYTGMPNIFGGIDFRGNVAKKLFSDEDIATRVDVLAIQEAVVTHNVDAMTSCAWDLKGVELILSKKDKTTTSDMLFEMAAQVAVEQGNAAALKHIVALAPDCKKYDAQLALKGKTRGLSKFQNSALPELIQVPPKDFEKMIKGLDSWQQPELGTYICSSFRGMSNSEAASASMLINGGRITLNPQMIAFGALELSRFPYDSKLGAKLDPAQIFSEAVELAIYKKDKVALARIAALYETAGFKDAEFAKYMQNELVMMNNTTRGNPDDAVETAGKAALVTFVCVLVKCLVL